MALDYESLITNGNISVEVDAKVEVIELIRIGNENRNETGIDESPVPPPQPKLPWMGMIY